MVKHKGRIGLVRHGQTYANIDRVWHGFTDTELTEQGHDQARRLGEHFHNYMRPDVIYASPLQRARITAQSIGDKFQVPVILDARLKEFNLGDWEGQSFESLTEGEDILAQLVSNPDFTAPQGESQNLVRKRIVAAIDEIVHKHPQDNIVIVAHGVAIAIALSHFIDGDTRQWPNYSKSNTAFSELCLNTNKLLSYNLTDHLAGDDHLG
ncbi:histidine phosphatase family protein [Pseudomaricurvus alcaniphilus]|uniref:histidine phosphatase family protein n=1 Tax=Pseudomaricurvus alcaniphilus TaxID=1166482 RepID=UPI00140C6FD9|nr:histidine phosphatase family protein [Pseudomaricurvus alcaniphilus]NHN38003.1 histidine phosphatase family protein [Pseudomaricurvus alcaniphilus]